MKQNGVLSLQKKIQFQPKGTGGNQRSFRDMMSPAERARYDQWWESKSWSLARDGAVINGRRFSGHALERMAPNTPEVRATLEARASEIAIGRGYRPGTSRYSNFVNNYVQPRNIPPSVVEDAIRNGVRSRGSSPGTWVHQTSDVKVITNMFGDVITVMHR